MLALPEPSPALTAPLCGLAQVATGLPTSALALLAMSATLTANTSVEGVSDPTIAPGALKSTTSLLATSGMLTVSKKSKKAHAGNGKNAKYVPHIISYLVTNTQVQKCMQARVGLSNRRDGSRVDGILDITWVRRTTG